MIHKCIYKYPVKNYNMEKKTLVYKQTNVFLINKIHESEVITPFTILWLSSRYFFAI